MPPCVPLGNTKATREYRAIIVATGLHNKKNRVYPEPLRAQAAASALDVMHSSEYRNPAGFAGKRVLVVGLGVSGTDIANEVSRVAARTLLSFRTAPWIVPANVLGRPGDLAALGPTSWLPFWLQRESFRVIQAMTVGHPRGLPVPTLRLLDRFAVTERGIVEAIKSNRVTLRATVGAIESGVAYFDDEQHDPEPIDTVLFATGYKRSYPMLDGVVSGGSSLSDVLPFLVFHPQDPTLAFMAETITPTGCWPIFLEQGRAIAAYFSSEQRNGSNFAAFNARRLNPSPDFKGKWYREADGFHVEVRTYTRALRKLTAWLSE